MGTHALEPRRRAGVVATAAAAVLACTAPAIAQDAVTAGRVLDAALEAMGGADPFNAIESVRYELTRAHAGGIDQVELLLEPEGRYRYIARGETEKVEAGSSGNASWELREDAGAFECRLFAGAGQRTLSRPPLHDFVPSLLAQLPRTVAFGQSEFAGRLCEQLVTRYDDGGSDQSFFDPETHLPVGLIRHVVADGRVSSVTFRYDDWHTFGPIRLFTTITVTPPGAAPPEFLKIGDVEFLDAETSYIRVPDLIVDIARSRLAARDTPPQPPAIDDGMIAAMSRTEAYDRLVATAQARSRAAGSDYLLELRLRHEFDRLMARLHELEQTAP